MPTTCNNNNKDGLVPLLWALVAAALAISNGISGSVVVNGFSPLGSSTWFAASSSGRGCSSTTIATRPFSCSSSFLLPPSRGNQCPQQYRSRTTATSGLVVSIMSKSSDEDNEDDNVGNDNDKTSSTTAIDVSLDERLYRIRLPRATGIEWGTDLSFSFVYVRDMDPTGAAALSKQVQVGHQLCEVRAVGGEHDENDDNNSNDPINLVGASFDNVMSAFANLAPTVQLVDLVFFRGTKEELKAACTTGDDDSVAEKTTISITVIQNKGSPHEITKVLQAPIGVNLRQVCIDNDINVYQSVTRWTNCKGKQLCGTCIVNVTEGAANTNRKSMDEESTLRENPDCYRLSCITFCYDDVTIETFPPISAAQWTR